MDRANDIGGKAYHTAPMMHGVLAHGSQRLGTDQVGMTSLAGTERSCV